MKNLFKILLVGIISTICRILVQFLIPAGKQTVLQPSLFATNGTMQMAFSLYGIIVYSLIASLFFLICNHLSGNRILQGLKYGLSCCVVWIAYLYEPLPHVVWIDRITYPLADGVTLLIMGLLLGILFGKTRNVWVPKVLVKDMIPLITISVCFTVGRLIQYNIFDIYSSFNNKHLETMIWCVFTGLIIAGTMIWLNRYIRGKNKISRAIIIGSLLFGLDLLLFNFFMPLVFKVDIWDLILRTVIDICAVTLGCLTLKHYD
ncbi:hypothetical protein [Aminipila terrae]|uniref:Uncharacterized protein n=1 Tax=Aminipila terrae TaxID=2697030 RepID=A0A6P1MD58_9FIRM|nr:hypothetical protein [Aminipila terrae]QHI71771.1 hypothetical protein Ami3637_04655 [Aminipila terrae]